METSILKSTKKILGIDADYTAFDLDIITYINTAFGVVNQLGVGPDVALFIEDENPTWVDLDLPQDQLNVIKTYVFLRVKLLFDPPSTSFVIEATNKQLEEYEMRLSYMREAVDWIAPLTPP